MKDFEIQVSQTKGQTTNYSVRAQYEFDARVIAFCLSRKLEIKNVTPSHIHIIEQWTKVIRPGKDAIGIRDGLDFLLSQTLEVEINANELGEFYAKMNRKQMRGSEVDVIHASMTKLGWGCEVFIDSILFTYYIDQSSCPC